MKTDVLVDHRRGAVSVEESRVVTRARHLLAKMDLVHANPLFRAVWVNAQVHGMTYRGDQYTPELESLREALDQLDRDRGGPRGS